MKRSLRCQLLALVFAFAGFFQDGEAGFLGIGDGKGLEFDGRTEGRKDFANRLFAGGAFGQFRRTDRSAQGEFPAAGGAATVAKFIFVIRHGEGNLPRVEGFFKMNSSGNP